MSDCQQKRRAQGLAYPRTCQICGLGPCKYGYAGEQDRVVTLPWSIFASVLIGGNHLATLIGADHPPYSADYDTAREHYRIRRKGDDWDAYEAWVCWKSIMLMRDAVERSA